MEDSDLSQWTSGGDDATDDQLSAEAEAVAGDRDPVVNEIITAEADALPDVDGDIELAVATVDYTVEGQGDREKPVIHVFGRTEDDEAVHVRVHGFRPYFYAPSDSITDDDLSDDAITGTEEDDYESIRGEDLTRIYGRTPRDVGNIRDRFEHYEADILFPNRFLIDKDITSGLRVPAREAEDGAYYCHHDEVEAVDAEANLRVNVFDIEVNDREGFPEDGEEPIICLSSHDSYRDEYIAWLYTAPDAEVPSPSEVADYALLDEERDATVEVRAFDEEEVMLDAFIDYIQETNPDVLTGWNFDDFDAPYFIDRCDELGVQYSRLSRVNQVWTSGWGGPDIKGRVVFDLLYAYERTQRSELDSYRLDAVGEVELGVGKERYTGKLGDLWEQDPETLLEYNLRDVELCVEIDRKQDLIAFWEEVASFVGCKLEDATTPGDAVDMYVLHKVFGKFVLPSKGQQEAEDYEGGAVFDPITGVKENVTVLDLKSLYPMCMVTVNASPETKVDPDQYDGDVYRAPNGTHFRQEPDGIIREMVTELLREREQKKSMRDEHPPDSPDYQRFDDQQAAVKVIMNSLYGVLGWERFRLYDKEMGAAVTATGRKVIEFTETAANEKDKEVVYGDSVTGDRPVVVRDPDGFVRILPIEVLFERGVTDSEILIAADGDVVARATPEKTRRTLDGWDALSVNAAGEPEWRSIQQVIRHRTEKPVVKLQHKLGESTTTHDHSYVTEADGEFVETMPEDVSEPLRVPGIPDVDTITEIDVYDVLSGYTRVYEDGRSVGADNATEKVKRVCADDEYVWFGHDRHGELDSTVKVKRHIDLDSPDGRALIRLLAAYVTEGSASTVETTDAKYGASIAESSREWLTGIQNDYYRIFENATAGITASDSRNERSVDYETTGGSQSVTYDDQTLKLQMMNELSAVFFREFAGQTSRGKRIPSFVFHLEDDLQDLFLKVLIEGDGSRAFPRYSETYAARNFDFETTSRELAAGLSILLTQRGQKHSFKYRDEKNTYTVRTCDYYRSGRDPVLTNVDHDGHVYDLSVEENENFVDAVGGVVLHNTDSVMLELGPGVEKDDAIEQSFEIEDHINGRYDEFAKEELNADEHRFQIEFEKLYRRFFQAGKKKRYAGHIIWKEGKDVDDVDITGFEYKRSDIAPITKEVQKRVIELIVREGDIDAAEEYVHDIVEGFQSGEVDLDQIGIPGGIGKRLDNYDTDTAHVRGAKYANMLLGTNFARGSKPKRLYLKKVHPDFWQYAEEELGLDPGSDPLYAEFKTDPDVICYEYADQIPDEFEIDWEKMLDKTLKGPIERVIEAVGVSWEEVKSGQTQTGLESFM